MLGTTRWRIELLDWLYDLRPDQPGERASFGAFVEGRDLDEHTQAVWRDNLRQLRDQGLITLADGTDLLSCSAALTADGRSDVTARRERRHNPALRSSAARDAVVQWLYGEKEPRDLKRMHGNRAIHHEGSPFTTDELDVALTYLRNTGLVQGVRVAETVLLNPHLTARGIDCAEQFGGSVHEYLRSSGPAAATTDAVHVNAPTSAFGNRDVTHTATPGAPAEQLTVLLEAVRQAVPVLGLSGHDATTLTRNAATVAAELRAAEPDPVRLRTLTERIGTTLADHGGTALTAVLGAAWTQLMDRVGLPTA